MMEFHWPQITMFALMGMSLGMVLANHGKPHSDYNAWTGIAGLVINNILLWFGGFWG